MASAPVDSRIAVRRAGRQAWPPSTRPAHPARPRAPSSTAPAKSQWRRSRGRGRSAGARAPASADTPRHGATNIAAGDGDEHNEQRHGSSRAILPPVRQSDAVAVNEHQRASPAARARPSRTRPPSRLNHPLGQQVADPIAAERAVQNTADRSRRGKPAGVRSSSFNISTDGLNAEISV